MLGKEECYCLGQVSRLHSFKGEVLIHLDVDDPEEYNQLESVYVEIDGKLIPFFLERIQLRKKQSAVVKFEDVNTEERARLLVKAKLYLPLDTLPELDETEFYHYEIEGFMAIDEHHGEFGKVVKVIEQANNPLIEIDHDGTEILIPKRDEFIQRIDRNEKKIYLSAPEGLIEMYLG